MRTGRASRLGGALAVGLLISSCGGPLFRSRDGAPAGGIDVRRIPDAVPRAEPRSRYGNPPQYSVNGRTYRVWDSSTSYVERGIASWYGTKFHGRRTSSGEPYDMYAMTGAHRNLPLPTYARVTNLENGRSVVVKINDRGPFHSGRLIDLSYAAAVKLGYAESGTTRVEVRALDPGDPDARPTPAPRRAATAPTQTASAAAPDGIAVPGLSDPSGVYLQLGAFAEQANAERFLGQVLHDTEAPIRIVERPHLDGSLYKVQLGPFSDDQAVDRLAAKLSDLGYNPHRVHD